MRSCLAFVFALAIVQTSLAQTFNWAVQMPMARPGDVATDAAGNVYTTGRFSGTVDFDPGDGVTEFVGGSEGLYVQKLDASGKFVWAKSMTGAINAESTGVAIDNLSNVYVIGYFRGTVDFDPGPGTTALSSTAPTFTDYFILKLDVDGNLIWVKQLKNIYDLSAQASITVDGDGNAYCAGFFKGTVDFDPGANEHLVSATNGAFFVGFVLRLDASGEFNWVNTLNATSSTTGIATDGDHVYVTGDFLGTLIPDKDTPSTVYSAQGVKTDAFIMKLTSTGDFVWGKHIGGPGEEYGRSVALDANGNVFLTGEFQETADFNKGGTPSTLTSAGIYDIFLQKFDPSGNSLWVKQIGGTGSDAARKISVNSTGHIHVGGVFFGSATFKIEATPKVFTTQGGTAFILQVSPSEKIDWVAQYPVNTFKMSQGPEHVYATGQFFSTVDFDPGEASEPMTTTYGSAFVLQLGMEVPGEEVPGEEVPGEVTGIEEIAHSGFSVYPNPVKSVAFLKLEKQNPDKFSVRVLDMQKRIVKEQSLNTVSENQIDMTDLSEGLYIVELRDINNNVTLIRLMKN